MVAYRAFKNGKWEPRTKHGSKLIKGDRPWLPVLPVEHSPHEMNGKQLNRPDDLDRKAMLNQMREAEGLEPLAMHSDFVGGLIRTVFIPSWDAYLDTKLGQRHQPRYKDGRESRVESLCSSQHPPQFKNGYFILKNVGADLKFKPVDKHWEKELEGRILGASCKVILKPSGWYLCLATSTPAEVEKKALGNRYAKARKAATIRIKDKAAKAEAIANSPECQAALELVQENAMQIEIEAYMSSPCSKPSKLSAGIDPGVKAIVATDHGALFNPNISRGRIALHIEALQSELDGKRESNDRRLGAVWRMGKREATNAELKLQRKISRLHEKGANSSNMFNHKLATRLARTYGSIYWEDTKLLNMVKGVEPKLAECGTHYEPNNAAAKTGLNYALRHACMGDLRAKTKQRMELARKYYATARAPGSSKECHCCGEIGDRPVQSVFICLNEGCDLHKILQQADTNAGKNIRKRGERDRYGK